MNLTKVADASPFAFGMLVADDCFVLDNGQCGKIYIWKGVWLFTPPVSCGETLMPACVIPGIAPPTQNTVGVALVVPSPSQE